MAVFAVLFAIGFGVFFWRAMTTPYRGYEGESRIVEVQKGWASPEILNQLRKAGVVRDDFVPLVYLKLFRRGDSLKAGVYEFKGEMTPVAALDKLVRGDVLLVTVVIREGLDRFAVGALMAEAGLGSQERWDEVTSDPDLVRDLDPAAESLEGYLFPDTYKLTPGTAPERVAALMVENFRKNFKDELAFISTGLSVHDTVTLASIIETEAQLPEERPVIASVYLNRIRKGMLLQADPTVIYAMKLRGDWDGNIQKADLAHPSPYNTYRNRGLPPGPIANPGLASLRAAANPAQSDYLYFVSRNDGSHVFARTLDEHNRNVQEYQRNYFRRLREAQKQVAEPAVPPLTESAGQSK